MISLRFFEYIAPRCRDTVEMRIGMKAHREEGRSLGRVGCPPPHLEHYEEVFRGSAQNTLDADTAEQGGVQLRNRI